MPFHLFALAHQHGPAAVVGVFVVYKYAKFRLVCWRSQCVNEEVRTLTTQRLDASGKAAESDDAEGDRKPIEVQVVQRSPDDRCASCSSCSCPLWLRRDQDECVVQLMECGCMLHSKCLMDAALQQHGMTVPSVSDPFHVVTLLRRFFGVDTIAVDSVQCPGCGTLNSSWRRLPGGGGKPVVAASRKAAARALRRGEALQVEGLREALRALPERSSTSAAADGERWKDAAKSEKALLALLQKEGPDASQQLVDLLLAMSSDGEQAASESSPAESDDDDETNRAAAFPEPEREEFPGQCKKPAAFARVQPAFKVGLPVPEQSCKVETVEELEARIKVYSDFLQAM